MSVLLLGEEEEEGGDGKGVGESARPLGVMATFTGVEPKRDLRYVGVQSLVASQEHAAEGTRKGVFL